jgi:hypothetical protein
MGACTKHGRQIQTKFWPENMKREDQSLGKLDLEKKKKRVGTKFVYCRAGISSSCENSNEPSGL